MFQSFNVRIRDGQFQTRKINHVLIDIHLIQGLGAQLRHTCRDDWQHILGHSLYTRWIWYLTFTRQLRHWKSKIHINDTGTSKMSEMKNWFGSINIAQVNRSRKLYVIKLVGMNYYKYKKDILERNNCFKCHQSCKVIISNY